MNALKIKSGSELILLYLLLIFPLFILWGCVPQLITIDKVSQADIAERENYLATLLPIQALGNIAITGIDREVSFPIKIYYITPDTLKIWVFDLLGRELVRVGLNQDEYEVWVRQENKLYHSREIPAIVKSYLPVSLSTQDLRRLIWGIPVCGEKIKDVKVSFKNFRRGLTNIMFENGLEVHYLDFTKVANFQIAQSIEVKVPNNKIEIIIHLNSILVQKNENLSMLK